MTNLDLRTQARHHHPAVTADDLALRLRCLRDCGFSRAQSNHVFEALDLPSIDNIRGKLADLRALGFADPVKMITSSPAILGYAIDNIRGKLADLRALGFADPVKMITSSPAILGYAIDNIRGKLADLRALGFADPVKTITSLPTILGYAPARVRLCGNIIMCLDDCRDGMFSQIISLRREIIDTIAAANCRCWNDVRACIASARSTKLNMAA